jgi:hypothetical protein
VQWTPIGTANHYVIRRKMPYGRIRLPLALLAVLGASCTALDHSTTDTTTTYIDLDRPTVVAFLPSSMRASRHEDAPAAKEQVKAAIERTRACLGEDYVSYHLVFADRIVVRSPGREESFEIANVTPLVGALLLRPDANARILFAGGGPEALRRMLRRAASDYFDKKCDG